MYSILNCRSVSIARRRTPSGHPSIQASISVMTALESIVSMESLSLLSSLSTLIHGTRSSFFLCRKEVTPRHQITSEREESSRLPTEISIISHLLSNSTKRCSLNKSRYSFWEAKSKRKQNLRKRLSMTFSMSLSINQLKRKRQKFQRLKWLIHRLKSLKRRKKKKKLVQNR